MFTGLIHTTGRIAEVRRQGKGTVIRVGEVHARDEAWQHGESICVQGACLTLTEWTGNVLSFDVLDETLNRTTLGSLQTGARVNIERALRLTDRLGGHIVTGHIDGIATVTELNRAGRDLHITIKPPYSLMKYCAEKGSITLDGVSLTISHRSSAQFSVCIIPTTCTETTIGAYRTGCHVNIEVDVMARYIEALSQHSQTTENGAVSERFLFESGFA